jgi:hypothetical protein
MRGSANIAKLPELLQWNRPKTPSLTLPSKALDIARNDKPDARVIVRQRIASQLYGPRPWGPFSFADQPNPGNSVTVQKRKYPACVAL